MPDGNKFVDTFKQLNEYLQKVLDTDKEYVPVDFFADLCERVNQLFQNVSNFAQQYVDKVPKEARPLLFKLVQNLIIVNILAIYRSRQEGKDFWDTLYETAVSWLPKSFGTILHSFLKWIMSPNDKVRAAISSFMKDGYPLLLWHRC